MNAALSRAVMALAVRCLGQHRREWAVAMEAEFEAADDDGSALSFAWGCLTAAWCELPRHEEGRFAIASHLLCFILILPMAALPLSAMLADFPYAYLAAGDARSALSGGTSVVLNEANRAALPALAGLLVFLAGAHLRIAWLVLERDWSRIAAPASLASAATMTLILFTALVFASSALAPVEVAMLGAELACLWALAHWHRCSLLGPAPEAA